MRNRDRGCVLFKRSQEIHLLTRCSVSVLCVCVVFFFIFYFHSSLSGQACPDLLLLIHLEDMALLAKQTGIRSFPLSFPQEGKLRDSEKFHLTFLGRLADKCIRDLSVSGGKMAFFITVHCSFS